MEGTTKIGTLAAKLMQSVEEDYGEEAQIGIAAIAIEVVFERDGELATQICYNSTDNRRWVQGALFDRCRKLADY